MEAVSQWQPEHVRQLWNSGSVFPGWLNEDLRDVGSQANANCGRWSHCLPIIFDPAGLQHWAPRMEDRIEMFGRLYANFINCLISCRSALSEWSRLSQLNEAAERLQKRIFEATSPIFMNLQKSGRPLKPHFSDPDSMKALEGKDFDDTMLDDMFEIIAGGRTECGPAAEAGPAASSPAEPQQPAWVANIPSATLTELKLIACIANPDAFPADLESEVTTLQPADGSVPAVLSPTLRSLTRDCREFKLVLLAKAQKHQADADALKVFTDSGAKKVKEFLAFKGRVDELAMAVSEIKMAGKSPEESHHNAIVGKIICWHAQEPATWPALVDLAQTLVMLKDVSVTQHTPRGDEMARQESTIYDVLRSIIYQDAQMCLELMRLSQELMALITAAAPQRKAGEVSDGAHNEPGPEEVQEGQGEPAHAANQAVAAASGASPLPAPANTAMQLEVLTGTLSKAAGALGSSNTAMKTIKILDDQQQFKLESVYKLFSAGIGLLRDHCALLMKQQTPNLMSATESQFKDISKNYREWQKIRYCLPMYLS